MRRQLFYSSFLLTLPLAAIHPNDGLRGPSEDPEASAQAPFDRLREALESEFPLRDDVLAHVDEIRSRLVALRDQETTSDRAGECRLLEAEVLLVRGTAADRRAALDLWGETARSGPRDEDRARALYCLGDHHFLRGGATGGAEEDRSRARTYFRTLTERHPESTWAPAARDVLAYLDLAEGGTVEDVRVTLVRGTGEDAEKVERSLLPGDRITLLFFWTATTPGYGKLEQEVSRQLDGVLAEYPILEGEFEAISVNLDEGDALFSRVLERWTLPLPIVHDGKGFEGDVAKAFHIPRVPHFAVVLPSREVSYLGGDPNAFLARASAELKARRKELEAAR